MTLRVDVWADDDVDNSTHNAAVDVLNSTLDNQLNFDVDAYLQNDDFSYDWTDDSWSEVKDDYVPYINNKWGSSGPPDNSCQLVIIDSQDDIGAGIAWGQTAIKPNPFDNSYASGAGVNSALNSWIEGNPDCDGDGSTAYRNTVMQEVLHTMLDENVNDSSYPESGNEHSLGGIYDGSNDYVSPMMTWYSTDNCSGNTAVNDNCYSNPGIDPEGFSTNLTSCTVNAVEEYQNQVNGV
jgi:hypothetical protein